MAYCIILTDCIYVHVHVFCTCAVGTVEEGVYHIASVGDDNALFVLALSLSNGGCSHTPIAAHLDLLWTEPNAHSSSITGKPCGGIHVSLCICVFLHVSMYIHVVLTVWRDVHVCMCAPLCLFLSVL